MTQHNFLVPALTGLAKLQIHLDKKGGPSEDGQLFEQILEIQNGILKGFGLPISPDNEKLIWFSQLPTDDEVNERVKKLHKTATTYLLSNAKPELQTLREAQEQQQDPFIVLPELKLKTHSYTLFVYNKILLKRKDTLENILHDLKFTTHYPEVLDALERLEQKSLDNEAEVANALEKIGVKYLQEFIIHNSNLLDDAY